MVRRSFIVVRKLFAIGVLGFLTSSALGQQPKSEVVATYLGLTQPAEGQSGSFTFRYSWVERGKWVEQAGQAALVNPGNTPAVGILNWEVPQSQFATAGMDRRFRTYCAEAPIGVSMPNTYRFEIQSPEATETYHLPNTEAGRIEAKRRVDFIRELYGRYYIPTLTNIEAAKAFQIALWEIIHESQLNEDPSPFSLTTGNFKADYQPDFTAAPSYVQTAQDYLTSLTGNELLYYENPDLAGLELVRMKGLVSSLAGDTIPQSQLALQAVRGGGATGGTDAFPGVSGGSGGLGPGGVGGGGFGSPLLGGIGAFGGAGSGSGTGTGTTSSSTTPTTAPLAGTTTTTTPSSSTTTTAVNTPPLNAPGSTTSFPPVTQNPLDGGNPVPAPAGLILGLVAIGAVAGRRALHRFVAR